MDHQSILPRTIFLLLSASWCSIALFSSLRVGVEGGLKEEMG
jgi:hypothetical protein